VKPELTEEQAALRDTAIRFLETESPLAKVRELYESADGFEPGWWRAAAELGWTSMFVPEALGGGTVSGNPVADAVIVAEEIGRLVAPGPFLPTNVVAAALARGGSEDKQAEILPGLAAGDLVAGWAYCEENGRWDASGLKTRVRADGSDWIIDGVKRYVEAAPVADHLLVTAVADEGLTQLVVPVAAKGVSIGAGRSIDMTKRFGAVTFEATRVPKESLVGRAGLAGSAVEHQLSIALALQCAEMVGAADHVLEFTLAYGSERFAFGRPIVSYQAIKHRVADLIVRLEGSKAVTDALAAALDVSASRVGTLGSVAKAYVAETCLTVVDECVQITGGMGVTWEHDLHLYNRRVAVDHAVFGTPEEHKRRIVRALQAEAA
jgi:alkylation response protein AidB-like acyl-CoA dehydrogenase